MKLIIQNCIIGLSFSEQIQMFVFNLLVFASCRRQLLLEEPYACDFKCWMNKLNITIDYYETTTSAGFLYYNLTLRDLSIHNMDLLDIKSTYYPNPDKIEDGLTLYLKANVAIGGNLRLYQTAQPTPLINQVVFQLLPPEYSFQLPSTSKKTKTD